MNPGNQRTEISKACGWTLHDVGDDAFTCKRCGVTYSRSIWKAWEIPYLWCKKERQDYPPDYLNDLNAMHEAEKNLNSQQQRQYLAYLISPLSIVRDTVCVAGLQKIADATAAQRAEAFLKTLGLWENDKSNSTKSMEAV